jgi:hypothetical protein
MRDALNRAEEATRVAAEAAVQRDREATDDERQAWADLCCLNPSQALLSAEELRFAMLNAAAAGAEAAAAASVAVAAALDAHAEAVVDDIWREASERERSARVDHQSLKSADVLDEDTRVADELLAAQLQNMEALQEAARIAAEALASDELLAAELQRMEGLRPDRPNPAEFPALGTTVDVTKVDLALGRRQLACLARERRGGGDTKKVVAKAVNDEVVKASARSRKRDVAMGYHRTTQPGPVAKHGQVAKGRKWPNMVNGNPLPPALPVPMTPPLRIPAFGEDAWRTSVREEKEQREKNREAAMASVLALVVPGDVSARIVGYTQRTWFGGEFERRVRAMQNLERRLRRMQAAKGWSGGSN